MMGAVSIPIAVLGAGSFGTCLAVVAAREHDVTIWARDPQLAESINRDRKNPRYLTDVALPDNVRATADLAEALRARELVICAIPSQFVRDVMTRADRDLGDTSILISTVKGIETGTCMLMDEVFRDVLDPIHHPRLTFLSGPSFARELVDGQPTAVTVACREESYAVSVQESLSSPVFRCYTGTDVVGVELGGALKNVIAIAAGVCDGIGFGDNTKAALCTRGLAEMARLGVACGARRETFFGLSGVGDLVVTAFSAHSRNRSFGERLGRGESMQQILDSTKTVAEGVRTARSLHQLAAASGGVETPIAAQVYAILYENKSPGQAVQDLMARDAKAEFEQA